MLEEFNVFNFLIAFFGFFVIITIVALIFAAYMARQKKHVPDQEEKVLHEKETIREIVMVPCQYCGSLIPSTALTCSTCGAGRKA
jgi:hypothetical protein